MRNDVYQIVTDRIMTLLESGTIPWRKPWKGGEPPQNLVPAAVGIGHQRLHRNAAFNGLEQCLLNLRAVQPEDENLDTLLGLADRRKNRLKTGLRLHKKLHARSSLGHTYPKSDPCFLFKRDAYKPRQDVFSSSHR